MLDDKQRDFFETNGFLTIDGVLPTDEIEFLSKKLVDLLDDERVVANGDVVDYVGHADQSGPKRLPQVMRIPKYLPEFREMKLVRMVQTCVASLMGCEVDEVLYHGSSMLRKAPGTAPETPWHQDEAYHRPDQENFYVPAFIPLCRTTRDNGCIEYIPRSHKGEVLPHRAIDGMTEVHGIEVDWTGMTNELIESAVPCEQRPGDVGFHHIRTIHRCGPNQSSDYRDCMVLIMGPASRPRPNAPQRWPWQVQPSHEIALQHPERGFEAPPDGNL